MVNLLQDYIMKEDLIYIANEFKNYNKLKNKTIFVTGATGLIGSLFIRAILYLNEDRNTDIKLILLVRNKEKLRKIFGNLLDNELIIVKEFDITEPWENYIFEEDDIDYILHAAAVTASKIMIEKPVECLDVALTGTKNMLEIAKYKEVEGFLYISSMEVYGVHKLINGKSPYIRENDLGYIDHLNIRSNYPESKRMCENMCRAYWSEYNVPIYIARLAQVFGAGILEGENRVFAQFARSVVNKKDIVLHTTGESEGNYCYTRDAILGLLTILTKGDVGEAYNVVNEDNHISICDMAKMVAEKIANDEIQVKYDIPPHNIYGYPEPTKMKLSNEKLVKLGWKPSVNLEESYRRMIVNMKK